MKKFLMLVSLILVAVLVVPTYAARPTPTTTQMVVSGYFPFSFAGVESQVQNYTLLTVPEGKTFVLIEVYTKEISGQNRQLSFTLFEDAEPRFSEGGWVNLQLNSGLAVPAGSTVSIRANYRVADLTDPAAWSEGCIFASGYLLNNSSFPGKIIYCFHNLM